MYVCAHKYVHDSDSVYAHMALYIYIYLNQENHFIESV